VRTSDNLPPSCAVVTKSGNRNFLEPSGSVQACSGTALPSYFRSGFNSLTECRILEITQLIMIGNFLIIEQWGGGGSFIERGAPLSKGGTLCRHLFRQLKTLIGMKLYQSLSDTSFHKTSKNFQKCTTF